MSNVPRLPARPECSAELLMASAGALRTVSCAMVARVWRLVGIEVGTQLSRGRGVRVEDGLSFSIGRDGRIVIVEQAHRLSYESIRSSLSRSDAAACVRHVVAQLKKRARRKSPCELFLRPVGKLYTTKDGEIALNVFEDFRKGITDASATSRPLSRKKMHPPPSYSSCVGKKKRPTEEQPTFEKIRWKLVQRHGADALCILGRTLAVWEGDVEATMQEMGIILTPQEFALFSRATCEDAEDALGVPSAHSPERREVVDRAWRDLCVSKSRVDDAKIKGVRREGGSVETDMIPLAFLERRCTGCCKWLRPPMLEDEAIARLLGHFEPSGNPPIVSMQHWRNAHFRLSAAFEKKDQDFAVWLRELWGIKDTTTTPKKRIETDVPRKQPRIAWPVAELRKVVTEDEAYPTDDDELVTEDEAYPTDDDESVSLPRSSDDSCEVLDATDEDDASARLAGFLGLRPMVYVPPCDFAEFCSRLGVGCLSVPDNMLLDDVARRIERRARTLGLGGASTYADDVKKMCVAAMDDSSRINLKSFHERLVSIFGRCPEQVRIDFGRFAPLVPATEALHRAAAAAAAASSSSSRNGSEKGMDLCAFRHFLNATLCLGLGAKQVNDIFDTVAAGKGKVVFLGDLIAAMGRAAPSRPHRSVAVGRLHAMLRSRAGDVDPMEKMPLFISSNRSSGRKSTVSRREFQEKYDLVYGLTVDSDLDFYNRLRNAWEDVEDWSSVASALFFPASL